MFQIPYPEIERVQRRQLGQANPGDSATARLAPGIIEFLETRIVGQAARIGEGYQAPYTVPFGLAATAAYAVIAPAAANGVQWTGRDIDIEWLAKPETGVGLTATAELESIDGHRARFRISSTSASGRLLLRGSLQLSSKTGPRQQNRKVSSEEPAGELLRPDGHRFLRSVRAVPLLRPGAKSTIHVRLENRSLFRAELTVLVKPPFGGGLSLDSDAEISIVLGRFSTKTLEFVVRADRPDEVNLSQPWALSVLAMRGGREEAIVVPIRVPDPEAPAIFYVLTEDCETFDGGPRTGDYGTSSCLGNANNFMDPEDYRIQMIDKPNRMNSIADQFGAKWTHFWCAPQRFAVDWARQQSATGAWDLLAGDLDASVRNGSERHEYAPHIHFDYEPTSLLPPQPRLLYDAATDGILPNEYYDPVTNPKHAYHDWDGSGRAIRYVKLLGDLSEIDSKAGSLRKTIRYLARLQANRRYSLIARTGGLDFGIEPEDQRISTEAYLRNGLTGNSDAAFAEDQLPLPNCFYWCQEQDRNLPIERLEQARLVQLAVSMQTDFTDVSQVNAWLTRNLRRMQRPGVRVLTSMTHAMFMRGDPDAFRSLTGGSFDGLRKHLEYVTREHPRVRFATATEALVEFLDYYSPELKAYVSPGLLQGESSTIEHSVRLLGRGIRVDQGHPATLACPLPPIYEAGEIEMMTLIADGVEIGQMRPTDVSSRPQINATLTSRPNELRLRVTLRPEVASSGWLTHAGPIRAQEPAEPKRGPLLRVRPPERGVYSLDVLRLLMHPAAGGEEPLGRRIHPVGCYSVGISLHQAFSGRNEFEPCKLKLRWRKVPPDAGELLATKHQKGSMTFVRIIDEEGDCVVESEVTAQS